MATLLSIAPYTIAPAVTGGQKGILGFVEFLAKKCSVVLAVQKTNADVEGVEVRRVFSTSKLRYVNFFTYFRLKKICRESGVSAIIVEHPYMAWLGYMLAKRLRLKMFIHAHNVEFDRFRSIGRWWWWLLKGYEGWAMRRADHVMFKTAADMQLAANTFHLPPDKCLLVPYGIPFSAPPSDRQQCRKRIAGRHGVKETTKIMLFFGGMSYKPNLDAVDIILDKVYPRLQQLQLDFTVLFCGKGMPDEYKAKVAQFAQALNVGFADDIDEYVKAADVVLNPVLSGGGIKTKIVEAIGFSTPVVSTATGAVGVDEQLCGGQLLIAQDGDWDTFAQLASAAVRAQNDTPKEFYDNFYWGSIVENFSRSTLQ